MDFFEANLMQDLLNGMVGDLEAIRFDFHLKHGENYSGLLYMADLEDATGVISPDAAQEYIKKGVVCINTQHGLAKFRAADVSSYVGITE